MKIEIEYKIGEHEDILSWVTENWWKTVMSGSKVLNRENMPDLK